MRRDPPLVKVLPRQPGTKESRYMHLFGGDSLSDHDTASVDETALAGAHSSAGSANSDRIRDLENEINLLRRELETLREQFANFQKQFK
jgi:uncharacterized protein YceH (UPF0502 family)